MSSPESPPSFVRRWGVAGLRTVVIFSMAAFSLSILCISLVFFWRAVLSGSVDGALAALLVGGFCAVGAWQCYKGGVATVLIVKGHAPARLDADMPLSFSSFLALLFMAFILLSVASPMFTGFVRKSNEGASKGNLLVIREALKKYRGDMSSRHPATLDVLTVGGKYLSKIPLAKAPNYHNDSSMIHYGTKSDDAGGWLYDDVAGDAYFGMVWVNCTHTDTKGSVWTSY